ncbi:MAG TPA: Xaa-Pro peptidase family protein [Stellaceae bacterium]|jgi:Xaa-Pro dipeptidase|nr:Xaa-Pro peptidase family protein [Stellaceae bacterium]HEX3419019.1 Xaa-Pro peptidase family protein [Stellaceae bacterium]
MALHFTHDEFAARLRRVCAEMAKAGFDGLLLFRQESMYWLTGYDTSGYSMFQGLYLRGDGALALLTRSADLRQAHLTSVIEDIRVWTDRDGANPAGELRDLVAEYGGRGKRLGIEYHAYGLTAQRGRMVDAAFAGFCELVDASDLVRLLRLVKSPAELAYLREAGRLVDEASAVSRRLTVPGAALGAVYGEMINTIMRGGGDPSASRWPMGCGEEALLVRYHTGHGAVAARDQAQFEIAAAYRHYHAALMYVILTGEPDSRHRDMFTACAEALDACEAALRPGNTVGQVFAAHAEVLTKAGYAGHFLNACGYTMGATYPPTWMDWPMLYAGEPQVLAPNMVFFLHMILLNSDTGLGMSLGETAIVTASGCEPISHAPRQLLIAHG